MTSTKLPPRKHSPLPSSAFGGSSDHRLGAAPTVNYDAEDRAVDARAAKLDQG